MARLSEVPPRGLALLQRLADWSSRRRFGKRAEPVGVMARHPWVLRAYAAYELALDRARRVDPVLKELAQIKAAMLVGCAF